MAPRIVVTGEVIGRDLHVTVDDNGPGLVREALDRLFQPFATTKPTGTGLGLAIVQKVIVSHNGVIAASNRARRRRAVSSPLAAVFRILRA